VIPGLLTAGNGQGWENDLVAELARPGSPMTVIQRCVDIADVLTAATTGTVSVVVLSGALRRFDTEAVQRLCAAGVAVVGVYPAGEDKARSRLARIGVTHLIADDVGAAALLSTARAAVAERATAADGRAAARGKAGPGVADPRHALAGLDDLPSMVLSDRAASDPPPAGRVLAIWGPAGAPGRTMLAANLAAEAALAGHPTLLVDADVYGGVLASAFGLLDESAGVAGACRLAANGLLDLAALTGLVWAVDANLRLLTGINRADRWPEVKPSAISAVLAVARSMADIVIVDCGFSLEADEEITFDTAAPRRNGATLAVLAEADVVIVIGSADPPGMERLIRGLAELHDTMAQCTPLVVLNRSRRTAASPQEGAAALARFAGLAVTATLPEERANMDKAWQRGVPLAEAAPGSALRKAIRDLMLVLVPATLPATVPTVVVTVPP